LNGRLDYSDTSYFHFFLLISKFLWFLKNIVPLLFNMQKFSFLTIYIINCYYIVKYIISWRNYVIKYVVSSLVTLYVTIDIYLLNSLLMNVKF